MKRKELAKWLKLVIIFAALLGLFLCFVIAPAIGRDFASTYPELGYMFWPCLIFIWITAVPFYFALYKAWMMSKEISKDNSFCFENAKRLKVIGKLALSESILYLVGMVILLTLNLLHPSIFFIIMFIIFVGVSIGIVSFTLSHLVEKASELKKENDLTI